MIESESKLSKFTAAVIKDANEQRSQIMADVEEYRLQQIRQTEEKALNEAFHMIQSEISTIRNTKRQEISKYLLQSRIELLKKRTEITEQVFEEAKVKISTFVNSPDYLPYLKKQIRTALNLINSTDESVLYVRDADLRLEDDLVSEFKNISVKKDDVIELGGFILVNHNKGLSINQSFDESLEDQKTYFAGISGLEMT